MSGLIGNIERVRGDKLACAKSVLCIIQVQVPSKLQGAVGDIGSVDVCQACLHGIKVSAPCGGPCVQILDNLPVQRCW